MAVAVEEPGYKEIPSVTGLPLVGNTLEMAKDPASFFVRCYKEYGPVYKVNVFGRESIVIAGPESAMFMSSKEGRESLRSKEFWDDFVKFHGAEKSLTREDGETHERLRRVMRRGFSREAVSGRYHLLSNVCDISIERDWKIGDLVPVVEAFQYMIVHQLGEVLTGDAPLEYVRDIRVNVLYLLNILVTRQRPKFLLHRGEFKKANARVKELGSRMVSEYKAHADAGTLPKNLIGDIVQAHVDDPELIPEHDLALVLTGPYVAGLDTVANTLAAAVYGVLKTPGVLEKVQAEADALFENDTIVERDVLGLKYINNVAKEAMRLWPIAVAQMRTATRDFEYEGFLIPEGEMIYIGTSVPHFMDEYFPDPFKFEPERYNAPRKEHLQRGAYSPFGRGPHTCLGQGLAEVQMSLSLARLFHRLNLSLDPPDYTLKTKTAPTPGPAMDFKVKVVSERRPAKALIAEERGDEA
ncbi:MAG: cytochrome P450 [Pseudomonadota bacterium]